MSTNGDLAAEVEALRKQVAALEVGLFVRTMLAARSNYLVHFSMKFLR